MYPLLSEDVTIGTVSFQAREVAFFTPGWWRRLFQMVADLLASGLRNYRNYLRDAKAIRDEFARTATWLVLHNINQPLATAQLYVNMGREALGQSVVDPAELRQYLQSLDEQLMRITNIREDLRVLFGPVSEQVATIDIAQLRHVDARRFEFDWPGHRRRSACRTGRAVRRGSSPLLEIALTVLVQNALDALQSHNGPQRLTLNVRTPRATPCRGRRFRPGALRWT